MQATLNRLRRLEESIADATTRTRYEGPPTASLGLLDWTRTFLPAFTSLPFNTLHRQIAADADAAIVNRKARHAYAGPRDTGKSVIQSLALPLREALEGREPYILVASETSDLAEKLLAPIREQIEGNPLIAAAYPKAAGVGPVWQVAKIQLRNGVVIEAIGEGKSMRGSRSGKSRPTLIIADDIQGDDHIWSPRLRERTQVWFDGSLIKSGAPTCNVFLSGNAVHRDAVVMRAATRAKWRAHRFRYILRWPDRMDLWEQWETIVNDATDPEREHRARAFYEENRAAMDAGAETLWPERYTLYDLMLERASEGRSAFERERQTNPLTADTCEWPESVFEGDLWFNDYPIGHQARVMFVDPSVGRNARKGDYSAIVLLTLAHDGLLYVEADLARRPLDAIAGAIIEHQASMRCNVVGWERVAMQEWGLDEVERQAAGRGIPIPIIGLPPDASKEVRIRRLGPWLSGRKFRFRANSKGTRLLFDQLREFPNSQHDDGPDALEGAVRVLNDLLGVMEAKR